ncbi:phage minor head protein [Ruegeria arenilitoris]|uniref:phage minor head protein n=1 Tax=Ruegeria arenilitoris TaxID=1173585 RepID=UPI00147D2F07|nr:phage minor head protein [Ruegeria arenilitoris]
MKHETKFANWIRKGGQREFTVHLKTPAVLDHKFTVIPERLLASIMDDALRTSVERLNAFLPQNLSINISGVDTSDLKAELSNSITSRLNNSGVPVDPNDPVIEAAVRQYAERLNGRFQQSGLGVAEYIWRSSDDDRVRSLHMQHDDQVFSWDSPPEGDHPGEGFNCRCFAEPVTEGINFPDGAVCDVINKTMLNDLFPNAAEERLQAIAREIDLQIVTGNLNSPERLAHFFGQVRQEVGPSIRLEENLNYRATALPQIFSYFRRNRAEAQLFGRTSDHPADQEAIANRVYANRIGNGGVASGDGWRFRGRGLKQLTGRANYRAFTRGHEALFGEAIDFEQNPDLLSEPKYAVRSAIFFWVDNNLHTVADRGITRSATDAITRVINRHTDSYGQRWNNTRRLHREGTFSNVCKFSVAAPRFEDQ